MLETLSPFSLRHVFLDVRCIDTLSILLRRFVVLVVKPNTNGKMNHQQLLSLLAETWENDLIASKLFCHSLPYSRVRFWFNSVLSKVYVDQCELRALYGGNKF